MDHDDEEHEKQRPIEETYVIMHIIISTHAQLNDE